MSQPASTKKNNLKRSRYPISVSVLRQPFAMVIFFIATLNISKTTANKTDTYNYSTKYEAPCNNFDQCGYSIPKTVSEASIGSNYSTTFFSPTEFTVKKILLSSSEIHTHPPYSNRQQTDNVILGCSRKDTTNESLPLSTMLQYADILICVTCF